MLHRCVWSSALGCSHARLSKTTICWWLSASVLLQVDPLSEVPLLPTLFGICFALSCGQSRSPVTAGFWVISQESFARDEIEVAYLSRQEGDRYFRMKQRAFAANYS